MAGVELIHQYGKSMYTVPLSSFVTFALVCHTCTLIGMVDIFLCGHLAPECDDGGSALFQKPPRSKTIEQFPWHQEKF